MNVSPNAGLRQVISADQIQKRVRELGRQISDDYRGETMIALGILENSFLFMADLVRAVDVPLICSFIKPSYKQSQQGESAVLEILFSHELAIAGKHVLLVEGLVHSGVTSEYLMNDLRARAAASVKLVTLLDRQSARRVSDFWWMTLFFAAMGWVVRSRRDETCRIWRRRRRSRGTGVRPCRKRSVAFSLPIRHPSEIGKTCWVECPASHKRTSGSGAPIFTNRQND
jgi:hypoxanthine phosphoribosyltransferase